MRSLGAPRLIRAPRDRKQARKQKQPVSRSSFPPSSAAGLRWPRAISPGCFRSRESARNRRLQAIPLHTVIRDAPDSQPAFPAGSSVCAVVFTFPSCRARTGLGEAGRGSSTYRGPTLCKSQSCKEQATRTAVERSGHPTNRPARPSVFDTDTHSNSCRTVRRLWARRQADFMPPGPSSVATDLHSSLIQSLAGSSFGL